MILYLPSNKTEPEEEKRKTRNGLKIPNSLYEYLLYQVSTSSTIRTSIYRNRYE